jgi:chromosome segregation ATPase
MKNPITTMLLFAICFSLFSQQPISVSIERQTSGQINNNSYSVDIPQANLKEVKQDWIQYTSRHAKGKTTFNKGEYIQYGTVNTNIAAASFTLYSRLTETTTGVRLTAWLANQRTSTNMLSDNKQQELAVQKYLHDFAISGYKKAVDQELRAEQQKLESMEKEMAALVKSGERSAQIINSNDRSNEVSTDAISTNKSDIASSSEKIEKQKEMVDYTAADVNANRGAEKTLNNLEQEKKDLQRNTEVRNRTMDNRNKESRSENRNLQSAEQQYSITSQAIEEQRALVNRIQVKRQNIQ